MTFDPLPLLAALDEAAVDYVLGGDAAALIHGAPYGLLELEVIPASDKANLRRLDQALERLEANAHGETSYERCVTTVWGPLVVAVEPPGTRGYDDLRRAAVLTTVNGNTIRVASLADVIRAKEARGRDRDRGLLHVLRSLVERTEGEA